MWILLAVWNIPPRPAMGFSQIFWTPSLLHQYRLDFSLHDTEDDCTKQCSCPSSGFSASILIPNTISTIFKRTFYLSNFHVPLKKKKTTKPIHFNSISVTLLTKTLCPRLINASWNLQHIIQWLPICGHVIRDD